MNGVYKSAPLQPMLLCTAHGGVLTTRIQRWGHQRVRMAQLCLYQLVNSLIRCHEDVIIDTFNNLSFACKIYTSM